MTEKFDYDIAIVGCGPVGAAMANMIAKYGHRVVIFDIHEEVFHAPRAYGIDDETCRFLQGLGLLQKLRDEKTIGTNEIWSLDASGRRLSTFSASKLGDDILKENCGQFYLNPFHQPYLERALREEFLESDPAVAAKLGYRVSFVRDDGDFVMLEFQRFDGIKNVPLEEVTTELKVKYLIGCDGAKSIVQPLVCNDVIDLDYDEDYLVIDAIVDDEDYYNAAIPNAGYFTLDPKQAGVTMRGMHGHVRFDFHLHPDYKAHDEEAYKKLGTDYIKARGFDPDKFRPIRYAPYTFRARTPRTWRNGRLLLAGDAAHLTPPWSGQGLNMGIRDSTNLPFKLDLVLRGKASQRILDTYVEERQTVSLETIQAAVDQGKMMQASEPVRVALRNAIFAISRGSRTIRRALWRNWQCKPSYKKGLIGGTHKCSGNLMPQPRLGRPERPEEGLTLMDDMIGRNFALISNYSAAGPDIYRFVTDLGGIILNQMTHFSDPTNQLSEWFEKNKVNSVLLRPDRYIFDAGNDPNALCASLFKRLSDQE